MKFVVIESPYAGDTERNEDYGRRALLHSLLRGEAPFASHLLYTQALDDAVPRERAMGMTAGEHIIHRADLVAVYDDYGISPGMDAAIAVAESLNIPIEYRQIGKEDEVGPLFT